MRIGRIVAAAAIAVGTVMSMAPAASAAASRDVDVYTDDPDPKGGMAWFKAYGEHFGICDRDYDDLGVRGRLTYTHNGIQYEYKLWHHSGHHQDPRLNCNTYPDDINIPEGTKVYLQVCLQKEKGATLKYCDTDTGVA
ncbi:hypothetical protein [Lentzea aerocolonigenes]|uniref:hypothetical protein n=1 Tax=Lentzea aerocolonigenes TaxID=68170 RepID=UPI0004C4045D|nr:hypothetical protein [Lentzea aerocolonigenes]MCP2243085.1 hypothetical protein [Lentzea aerocolonigenes]